MIRTVENLYQIIRMKPFPLNETASTLKKTYNKANT